MANPDTKRIAIAYVDDVLIYSHTAEDHLKHLEIILQKFSSAGLTIKLRKSFFAREEVCFLGHKINRTDIKMDTSRIKAINEFPRPRNIRELRGFLGLINFDRRFCEHFSDLTLPLLKLLKKDYRWNWGNKEQKAFDDVKLAFLNVTIVIHPDFDKTFFIQADSSGFGLGACLYQLNEANDRLVIAYASRTLKGSEVRYHVHSRV